jgi:sec-independent protein translocase protein TatC
MKVPFGNRREKNADGTMSLMEHLYELRRRLFFAALGFFIGVVVGFVWYTVGIPALHISSLGDLLLRPYCQVPDQYRVAFNGGTTCELLATGPFSALQIRLNAALMVGSIISSPVWLYQLWAFIMPALYKKERRFARTFTISGAALFLCGALLAYAVIGEALKFLLGVGGDTVVAALDPDRYYSFLSGLLIIFGLAFELPLLLILLNMVGVLKGTQLSKARRYAFFGLVVFAGIAVPGNEPLSMLALAVSLCVLYEFATQFARVHDKRKARRLAAEGFGELADDSASPTPLASAEPVAEGEGGVSTIAPPAPVDTAQPTRRFDDFGDAT